MGDAIISESGGGIIPLQRGGIIPELGGGFLRNQQTMIPMPSGVRVWIATGHTDMRRGMQGLALQVQEQLKRDRGEGGPRVGVLGPVRQNMPDHHCQLSRGRDRRSWRTPISLDPLKERPQRTWRRLCGPRRLDEHLAGVRVSLLADPSVARAAIAGLANLRRQSEVATQLIRRVEPRDIADGGQDR
jgi:IS66 Orf2 like protein